MRNKVIIALGSNIDKEVNLPKAVALLADMTDVLAVSPVFETIPVGLREQENFLNAAVLIATPLFPSELKKTVLGRIEQQLKRVRVADKNAPRTIDADIVLYNDAVYHYDGRQIPDPDLLKFLHVAQPVAELLPDTCHPVTGETMHAIANRLAAKNAQKYPDPILWQRPDIQLSFVR